VRDVGDELPAHPVGVAELGGHRVEGAREVADLVARGRAHAAAVVAARHRGGGGGHLAQRRRHPAREDLHDDQSEQRGERRPDRQAEAGPVPGREHERRAPDRGDDHHAELDLDRAEAVERSHAFSA
jgi:hypothetical protein